MLFISAYIGGLLGARILSIGIEEEHFDFAAIWSFRSLTLYGGILGAALTTYVFILLRGLEFRRLWDLLVPPLLVGIAIGRVGCFLNGDDFGIPAIADSVGKFPWWSVVFRNHPQPIPRIPVQLIESAFCFILGTGLIFCFKNLRSYQLGLAGTIGMSGYCIERFFIEFYRDDYRGWFLNDALSTSQGLSLCIIAAIIAAYVLAHKSGNPTSEP